MDGTLLLSVSRSAQELKTPSKTKADGCTSSSACAASSKLCLAREESSNLTLFLNRGALKRPHENQKTVRNQAPTQR